MGGGGNAYLKSWKREREGGNGAAGGKVSCSWSMVGIPRSYASPCGGDENSSCTSESPASNAPSTSSLLMSFPS